MFQVLEIYGCFFFFQAEDGIRDYKVTGVQTCALPILFLARYGNVTVGRKFEHEIATIAPGNGRGDRHVQNAGQLMDSSYRLPVVIDHRSEERRVGKECRSRWSPYH